VKLISAAAAILACALLLSGCELHGSNYREIENLELMQTLGIDSDGVTFTVSAATGRRADSTVIVLTNSGKTVDAALKRMQLFTDKDIYFDYIGTCLIGEKTAEKDLYAALDYIEREETVRYDTTIFIIKGAQAKDAVTLDVGENSCVTDILLDLTQKIEQLGNGFVCSLRDLAQSMLERDCAAIAALEITDNGVVAGSSSVGFSPAGYAIIKDGRLICFSDNEQAHGITLLAGKMKSDTVEVSDGYGQSAALGVIDTGIDIMPEYESGVLRGITVSISMKANIDELYSNVNLYDNDELEVLEEGLANLTLARARSACTLAQDVGADIFDFGSRLEMKDPLKFEKIKDRWNDIFADVPITFVCNVDMERTYDIAAPLTRRNGETDGEG